MISLKNISKSFHKKSVLCDVSFQIPEHSITTIVGPNGIGKTTLLNILCGVLYPDSGSLPVKTRISVRICLPFFPAPNISMPKTL